MLKPQNTERDTGAVALVVALLAVVLLGVAALVVDLGIAMETRRDAQKVADLAALAGGQELPDQTAARAIVAQYLRDNEWPLPAGDPQSILNDDNFDNGEVDFGNGLAGTGLASTSLTVYPPSRSVSFLLSGVFNSLSGPKAPSGVAVSAAATVEIRSLNGFFPYQVPAGAGDGVMCVKSQAGTNANNEGNCPDKNQGDFGYLDIPRSTGSSATSLEENIRSGAEFVPTLIPNAEMWYEQVSSGLTAEVTCPANNSPPGAKIIPYPNPPINGFNCVAVEPSTRVPPVRDGLIGAQGLGCTGRLVVSPSTAGALTIGGCPISPDKFADYINPSSLMSDPNSWKPIKPSIANDPRFGVVPVLATTDRAGTAGRDKQYAVVRFYGMYYKSFYNPQGVEVTSGPGNNIKAVSAYVFPLDLVEGVLTNDQATIQYLGGAKVPVLVK